MRVKGWVKSSLLDYPGQIAASLFCGGCNFRCPHCQNSHIVLRPHEYPDIQEEEIWRFLEKRASVLDGVVISGGEPTLQPDLISFALRLHEKGFLVKLDTNGYLPGCLARMIAAGAVDYVAMDIKAPQSKYSEAAGVSIDLVRIQRSIDLLLGGDVPYEFRTTVAPGLLMEDDILGIAQWIAGASHYYLQQFVPHDTIDPEYLARVPCSSEQLLAMADLAQPWVGQVGVRGV